MSFRSKLERSRWVKWSAFIAAILGVPVSIVASTTRMYKVAASSMMPALVVGDRAVVNLMAYDLKIPFTTRRILRWSDPKAGDIVLFSVPNERHPGLK